MQMRKRREVWYLFLKTQCIIMQFTLWRLFSHANKLIFFSRQRLISIQPYSVVKSWKQNKSHGSINSLGLQPKIRKPYKNIQRMTIWVWVDARLQVYHFLYCHKLNNWEYLLNLSMNWNPKTFFRAELF